MLPRISSQGIGKEFGLFRGELSCYWLVFGSIFTWPKCIIRIAFGYLLSLVRTLLCWGF